jgi:hypothetical protein
LEVPIIPFNSGFYVDKVDHKIHAYVVNSNNFAHDQDYHNDPLDEYNYEDVQASDDKDLEFSFHSQELGKQLINAYSQVLASGYLTIQNLGGE